MVIVTRPVRYLPRPRLPGSHPSRPRLQALQRRLAALAQLPLELVQRSEDLQVVHYTPLLTLHYTVRQVVHYSGRTTARLHCTPAGTTLHYTARLQVVHYTAQQSFGMHHDSSAFQPRLLTAFYYLNK